MINEIKPIEIDPLVCKLETLIQSAVPTCAPCLANRIANFLIENGVVLLPIKLHDNIFVVEDGIIWPSLVDSVEFAYSSPGKTRIFCTDEEGCMFEPDDIGKTVFLSEDEAEAALNR